MGSNKITKATLKHVLYEGARVNRILLINDSCFEKMVEILNIPLDSDEENKLCYQDDNKNKTHLPILNSNNKNERNLLQEINNFRDPSSQAEMDKLCVQNRNGNAEDGLFKDRSKVLYQANQSIGISCKYLTYEVQFRIK